MYMTHTRQPQNFGRSTLSLSLSLWIIRTARARARGRAGARGGVRKPPSFSHATYPSFDRARPYAAPPFKKEPDHAVTVLSVYVLLRINHDQEAR